MQKIKEIYGNYYSRESITNYKHRVKVDLHTKTTKHSIELYTTQGNSTLILEDIKSLTTEKVVRFEITHIATREQDDLATTLIDEWLTGEG